MKVGGSLDDRKGGKDEVVGAGGWEGGSRFLVCCALVAFQLVCRVMISIRTSCVLDKDVPGRVKLLVQPG